MNPLTVLRAADYPRMPWKNGGGSTEEITRDAGEGLEGFGWRLSIADIGESGGFSQFEGYQRIISVLQGAGMNLQVDGAHTRALLPFDAFAFRGESAVSCTLLDGPIRDFNLIYSPRTVTTHGCNGWRLPRHSAFSLRPHRAGVQCQLMQVKVGVGHTHHELGHHDCLQLSNSDRLLDITVTGRCCLIELTARD
jgi:uncharacterized protein